MENEGIRMRSKNDVIARKQEDWKVARYPLLDPIPLPQPRRRGPGPGLAISSLVLHNPPFYCFDSYQSESLKVFKNNSTASGYA